MGLFCWLVVLGTYVGLGGRLNVVRVQMSK